MKIPKGYTKAEVIETLYNVARRLAGRFKFSFHEYDDIVQTGVMLGIQGLENYKDDKPLENFLYVHVKNRLCTFKRDNYVRPSSDKPCLRCPFKAYIKKTDFCKKFEVSTKRRAAGTKMDCDLYANWINRNAAKQNVKDMLSYDEVKSDTEPNMSYEIDFAEDLHTKDLLDKIERELPISFLNDFQRMKFGIEIGKQPKLKLMDEICKILELNGTTNA